MVGYLIAVLAVIGSGLLGRAHLKRGKELERLKHRFRKVIDADEEARSVREKAAQAAAASLAQSDTEVRRARAALEQARLQSESELESAGKERQAVESDRSRLQSQYNAARTVFDQLTRETQMLEENLEDMSYGVYRPHFVFGTSKEYKEALEDLWKEDKAMVRAGQAAVSRAEWQVGGSRKDGERMTKQYLKLLLRGFNAECDACMARVSWNNHDVMDARIRKSYEALNKLGTTMQMAICEDYLKLKLRELQYTHEHEEKLQEEKEEQRRLREQLREEEKVQRELAAAAEKAEREEKAAAKDLEKVRREAEAAADETQREVLTRRILELEAELANAHTAHERAVAQAQLTRSGHVYVLSNIGAFGEEIVKIGMTRRLEPRERVAELGDASVPFPFDLHALIYTDDAPKLETELHTAFWDRRINLANDRKEFFRIQLKEVESYLIAQGHKLTFEHLCEAKEYRMTCSERAKMGKAAPARSDERFPDELFQASA